MSTTTTPSPPGLGRAEAYLRFLIERGGLKRYGTPFWKTPERAERIESELAVVEGQGFSATFVMLAGVMDFCRAENIPVGPGRGSVGGFYGGYLAGIHDVDSLEWGLDFERFMNPDRVSFPDVDIDVSQRDRPRVLQYIVDTYTRDDQVVMQIGAFVRAGGRAVVDLMATALASVDPNAWATATNLKKCFPDKGSITGGQKIARELHAWLYEDKGHGDKARFVELAEQAGWLDTLLKLDGMFTHLGKHAAGVVILRTEDLPFLPTVEVTNADGERATVTAYDMYSLDDLGYLKWDWLGLRTLDVIKDAHQFIGGSGQRDDLIKLWQEHRDDPEPYPRLSEAKDLTGLFQMDTDGYKRTLRAFQPNCFDHLVQLVALYRPGAIDYRRPEDGKNMVEVFIDRLHGREPVVYDHPLLKPILEPTQGVILYQEQQMRIARELAGFTLAQADSLRRAIGKKKQSEMDKLMPLFRAGCKANGIPDVVIDRVTANIEAAARYSWNKSHAVEYAIPTWHTAWFPVVHPAAFFCAEINSWEDKKDRQANVIAAARQFAEFSPPDINVAEDRFIPRTIPAERGTPIVFGLNGIKGMGEDGRNRILVERMVGGPFSSFDEFCQRLPSLGTQHKLALIKCGAFDSLGEDRLRLLSTVPKGDRAWRTALSCGCESRKKSELAVGAPVKCSKHRDAFVLSSEEVERKRWTVAEHLNENAKRRLDGKDDKPLPTPDEWQVPPDSAIAQGEMEAMGYYISTLPLKDVARAVRWHSANVVGGEIERVTRKLDRNDNEYGILTLVQADLSKLSVMVFASNWSTIGHRCVQGAQLMFRGREDGGKFLADACWEPMDVRHHRKIKVWRDSETPQVQDFDGSVATVQALETAGYHVRLL